MHTKPGLFIALTLDFNLHQRHSTIIHLCEATAASEDNVFVSARVAESRQESLSPNRCEARADRDIHSPQHQSASRNISSGLSHVVEWLL